MEESTFSRLAGVGGKLDHPTYEDVCTDEAGHAEVVEVSFDPSVISYRDLLEIFWQNHAGHQYRSAIFVRFRRPIVTEIIPATTFWRAEDYHQQYLEKHGMSHFHI